MGYSYTISIVARDRCMYASMYATPREAGRVVNSAFGKTLDVSMLSRG